MDQKNKVVFTWKTFFYSVIVFAALTILAMFLDGVMDLIGRSVFVLWSLLTISGIGLVITVRKEMAAGKKKVFLLVTGFAAAGFFIFAVLHNALYAIGTITGQLTVINALLNFLGTAFFLAGVVLCPLGIIAGVVGTFILQKKQA